ncbi:MAG TPA: hypothetical protein VJR89_23510, partial [Polyangiales bacterium]|nr:hypothetical protein [Polyangiales bacterium]
MDAHDRMFGEIAVRLELLTRDQLAACRKAQAESPKRGLAQLALSLGLMSEAEIEMVSLQQRKVMERRREARDQRDAVVTQPDRPSRSAAPEVEAPRRESQPATARRQADSPKPSVAPRAREQRPRPPHDPLAPVLLESTPPVPTDTGALAEDDADDARDPTVPRVPNQSRTILGPGMVVPDLAPAPLPVRDERPGKR